MKWLAAAMILMLGVGSAMAQPHGPPGYAPIPPPRAERVPPPPHGRFAWQPGHWHWDGFRYVWIGGRYVEHRHPRHWIDGGWVWSPREGRWIWRPAHWN